MDRSLIKKETYICPYCNTEHMNQSIDGRDCVESHVEPIKIGCLKGKYSGGNTNVLTGGVRFLKNYPTSIMIEFEDGNFIEYINKSNIDS